MNNIEKLVSEITIEAIRASQRGKAFVFVDYHAGVNGVAVYARPIDRDFMVSAQGKVCFFGEPYDIVYLGEDGAEEKLEDILTKIKGL